MVACSSSSPTRPAGSSRQRLPIGTRICSISSTLPSTSARMTTARHRLAAAGIFPPPLAHGADIFALPHDFGRSRPRRSQLDQLVGDFVGVGGGAREMLGQHRADLRRSRRPCRRRAGPAFTSTSSAAIASPQVSGVVTAVIASSATISARCSRHRQIDEDAGAADRPALGGGLEHDDGAPPHPPRLGRARGQREPQRHPSQDQQHGDELRPSRAASGTVSSSPSVGSGRQPPVSSSCHHSSQSGRHAAQASTRSSTATAQWSATS